MGFCLQSNLSFKKGTILNAGGIFSCLKFKCRITLLLLVLCNFQLYATAFSQKITISKKNVSIDEVFRDIRKQTGYEFIYNSDVLPQQKRVDIYVSNASIEDVLNKCFENLSVVYTISGKTIMVGEAGKLNSLLSPLAAKLLDNIKGKVINAEGRPLGFVSIQILPTGITVMGKADGTFEIPVSGEASEITFIVSYVGKVSVTKTLNSKQFSSFQLIVLNDLSLKLSQVEVNGVRKKTFASNSSIVFDREAIEQTQALSVGDVLKYLPGQSMVRPNASLQGANVLTMRNVTPPNSEQTMNNAFGISVQIDGNSVDNNANMQAMNPGRMGFNSANNISTPNTLGDLSFKNGSLSNNYGGDVANNGVDLRGLQAENIESIEVISGVASARYGDYNTGVVIINRQAGITPLRVNMRTNEGTQNIGLNKGFSVSPSLGVLNVSFDYLNSNDDPRNKLKSYGRVGGGFIWTYHRKKSNHFKNTLSVDYNTTLDKTRRDPDDGNDRMSKFNNWNLRVSNRSELIIKKPWLYNISFQISYNKGRQDSYSQYYLNTRPVMGITNSEVTGTSEGVFVPGYYLAVQEIIGEPVSASARIETNTFIKIKKISYKLTFGSNYSYNANKGPGMIVFSDRPRFYQTGNKSDRARSFNNVPTQKNIGFYVENLFTTRLLERYYTLNVGARGDVQNGFFNFSPRINTNWKLTKKLNWSGAYGIATKSPSLSQISPGNVYVDIPLVNAYTGNADKSVYLVHTEVLKMHNTSLRAYQSQTFETGFTFDIKPFHTSIYYFDRVMKNGFSTLNQLLPVVLPNYAVTNVPGEKPTYAPDGTFKTYNVTYSRINNGNYNHSKGFEWMVSTEKIKSIATSFNLSLAYYNSYFMDANEEISLPSDQTTIDYTRKAVYGVYKNQESKAQNIKATITSSTHIPALRMAVMFTGEIYLLNKTENLATSIYPVGYMNKDLQYFSLSAKEAQSPDYAHLLKSPTAESTKYLPGFIYPNIHMRISKEIGDYLRFSFNAYNAFNIRPMENKNSSITYYNGRPAFGAELIFTIK